MCSVRLDNPDEFRALLPIRSLYARGQYTWNTRQETSLTSRCPYRAFGRHLRVQ
jgi:hypothetical protein